MSQETLSHEGRTSVPTNQSRNYSALLLYYVVVIPADSVDINLLFRLARTKALSKYKVRMYVYASYRRLLK